MCSALLALVTLAVARPADAQCPGLPGDAFAFLPAGTSCPLVPIVHFVDPRVVFECGFFAQAEHAITCGAPTSADCIELCRNAATAWNTELPGRFQYIDAAGSIPVAFCDPDDGRTSIGGSDTICDGRAFGSNVIAVTLRFTFVDGPRRGEQVDADVTVNQAFNSTFAGDPKLFRATITHELGHVLGLDHPDQCGRDANVLMRSRFTRPPSDPCFVFAPTADDVTGARMIYPVTLPTPTPVATPACGDPDGDGVTIIDAANVLRAAVGLPSSCSPVPTFCDVDASGGITALDADNVLQRGIGLPGANACPD